MDCASCVAKIQTAVGKLPGVADIKLSTMTEILSATVDEMRTAPEEVEKRVSALGYVATRQPTAAVSSSKTGVQNRGHPKSGSGLDMTVFASLPFCNNIF